MVYGFDFNALVMWTCRGFRVFNTKEVSIKQDVIGSKLGEDRRLMAVQSTDQLYVFLGWDGTVD